MKLAYIAAAGFALVSTFAAAETDVLSEKLAVRSASYDSGLIVAAACVPRPLPGCYYAPIGAINHCTLTPDEYAQLTCTGPYAN
ncbi:hypothetical protein IGB42_00966 [Andreprevotia sp. IGB-42]|nr:hypothetical protein IGB42_00966 [Andreprevotia sp. IGB-42]